MPLVPAYVAGNNGIAHGKSCTGSTYVSSVCNPKIRTRHLPDLYGSFRSSTMPT
jgi:hypothetical protein